MDSTDTLSTSTVATFKALFEGAGVPADEQAATMQTLVDTIRATVETTLNNEQAKLTALSDALPGLRNELATLANVLGNAAPAENTTLLLVPQHAALGSALAAAKAQQAERAETRTAKEEQLTALRGELDGEEGPNPEEEASRRESLEVEADAPGGLSLATLGRLQAKIDAAADEKAARAATIGGLREQAVALRAMLGYPPEEVVDPSAVSRAAIRAAEAKLREYQAEVERRQAVLSDCGEYIGELRAKLNIPEAEWTALPQADVSGLSQEVLEAYHREMERLEVLKAATLGPLL